MNPGVSDIKVLGEGHSIKVKFLNVAFRIQQDLSSSEPFLHGCELRSRNLFFLLKKIPSPALDIMEGQTCGLMGDYLP